MVPVIVLTKMLIFNALKCQLLEIKVTVHPVLKASSCWMDENMEAVMIVKADIFYFPFSNVTF